MLAATCDTEPDRGVHASLLFRNCGGYGTLGATAAAQMPGEKARGASSLKERRGARLLWHSATPPLWWSRQDPLHVILHWNQSQHLRCLLQTLKRWPCCLCSGVRGLCRLSFRRRERAQTVAWRFVVSLSGFFRWLLLFVFGGAGMRWAPQTHMP